MKESIRKIIEVIDKRSIIIIFSFIFWFSAPSDIFGDDIIKYWDMLFSKRLELEKEYYEWLEADHEELKNGEKIKDCPFSVITFLDSKGLLID